MSNIVVFDSGIGGLSVYRCLASKITKYDYVYYADNANFPYGNKTPNELIGSAVSSVRFLRDHYDIACIVIACNTLTATAIDTLRYTFPDILFVGTEPSVKQALNYTVNNIVVASTKLTANSKRLATRFNYHNVHFVSFDNLANLIEESMPARQISSHIQKVLSTIDFPYDCIVLGCTHYVLVKNLFKQQAFNCKIFDGNNGVADRVKKLLPKHKGGGATSVVLSRPDQAKYDQISALIRQFSYSAD